MKYQNLTGKDIQLPVRQPDSKSGVRMPVNHVVVKDKEIVEVSEDNLQFAVNMGMSPVGAVKSSVGDTEVETKVVDSEPKEESKKPTEKELFGLSKKEQIVILKELGVKEIPRFEKQRVAKIFELQ